MADKITLISFMQFTERQLNKLRVVSPRLEVHQLTSVPFDDLPEGLRNSAEILYGWGKQLNKAHCYPNLSWIQTHSAGVNYLLDEPVWQSQVSITNLSGVHAVPMAEYALAMILAFRWRLGTMWRFQSRSEWPQGRWDLFAGPELRGSTLGLVGYGAIAREVARQARTLGMHVLAANRSGRRRLYQRFSGPGLGDPQALIPAEIYSGTGLPAMLSRCDYVVVLAPLTPETHHLIGSTAFQSMKPTAFFLNLARGSLVDEAALIEALHRGEIAGAALDVFEEEPLPADSPLWQMDPERVIISPHVSGFTPNYDERASDLFAENVRRYVAGEPLLNLVNRERGY